MLHKTPWAFGWTQGSHTCDFSRLCFVGVSWKGMSLADAFRVGWFWLNLPNISSLGLDSPDRCIWGCVVPNSKGHMICCPISSILGASAWTVKSGLDFLACIFGDKLHDFLVTQLIGWAGEGGCEWTTEAPAVVSPVRDAGEMLAQVCLLWVTRKPQDWPQPCLCAKNSNQSVQHTVATKRCCFQFQSFYVEIGWVGQRS